MNWQNRRMSTQIEDRRGQKPGGPPQALLRVLIPPQSINRASKGDRAPTVVKKEK